MIEELHEEMENNNRAQEEAAAKSVPYKYDDILKNVIIRKDKSSPEKLLSELRGPGIFDDEKKHRYWVDDKDRNCFMVYARALEITWGYYRRYWRWYPEREPNSNVSVDVAELLNACWLEVEGDFETGYLTPDTEYEVSFVIKLKDPKYGWENKVDFILTLPQNPNDQKNSKRDLSKLPKEWSNIPVGKFTTSGEQSGRMDFMLGQYGRWKKGLVIKGVEICPKTSSS